MTECIIDYNTTYQIYDPAYVHEVEGLVKIIGVHSYIDKPSTYDFQVIETGEKYYNYPQTVLFKNKDYYFHYVRNVLNYPLKEGDTAYYITSIDGDVPDTIQKGAVIEVNTDTVRFETSPNKRPLRIDKTYTFKTQEDALNYLYSIVDRYNKFIKTVEDFR
jgi:hypothetical protein